MFSSKDIQKNVCLNCSIGMTNRVNPDQTTPLEAV